MQPALLATASSFDSTCIDGGEERRGEEMLGQGGEERETRWIGGWMDSLGLEAKKDACHIHYHI
jgi:hypothetical protein